MRLITQCPACSTVFRIVPDQLRLFEGWVRCGHCDQVFDANPQLAALGESAPGAQAETLLPWLANSRVEETQTPKQLVALDAQADAVLSFMPDLQAARDATWGIWRSQSLAFLACGVLALLLAAQTALMQRDRLAAMVPYMRPALVATCEVLTCALAPLRQIGSITIESSSFTRVKDGVYLLKAILKNEAELDLAAPALELTLTDTQDHALLRWVISADEYSGTQRLMAAGKEMAVDFPFSVRNEAATESIWGYRLLAFYP
ncbi:MAG: zinc-ribbon and DUF3426 domain-containing protein [Rhodoferax sp.]|nr:zinc-ribbon and DUF3426 domain-containing protein [Rhodoferax sp.]